MGSFPLGLVNPQDPEDEEVLSGSSARGLGLRYGAVSVPSSLSQSLPHCMFWAEKGAMALLTKQGHYLMGGESCKGAGLKLLRDQNIQTPSALRKLREQNNESSSSSCC